MSFRNWLISLTLLAFVVPAALAQNQTQTPTPTPTQTQIPTQPQPPGPTTKDPTDQPSQQEPTSDASAPKTSPPIRQPDDSKVKHDGSEKDVDAIGNRKIGGRGMGNWYSLESEIKLGREYAQQVEASAKLVQDPIINEYVNRIGQNLVRNSDAQVPFTIKVIDSDEVNAFALPGGFFYV